VFVQVSSAPPEPNIIADLNYGLSRPNGPGTEFNPTSGKDTTTDHLLHELRHNP
jgi:hypothetical protein